mmetsp:Transcript_2859/g.5960  ORF Transcript_2859/g.5960 Transcript_2859/m.5960 type:complete len:291 (-) Transcript_2859:130-1002(-)
MAFVRVGDIHSIGKRFDATELRLGALSHRRSVHFKLSAAPLIKAARVSKSRTRPDTNTLTTSCGKRPYCHECRRAETICLCSYIKPFSSVHKFGILTHPSEAKKVQNTGYISHLCLMDSVYAEGTDFTHDAAVREALDDPKRRSFLVYPDEDAADLTNMSDEEVLEQFGQGAMFWIVDGSWSTARKMVSNSKNLKDLPKVAFTPEQPSRFRIRRQPKEFCYSTIEAIHYILKRNHDAAVAADGENKGETRDLFPKEEPFDNLLRVFDSMVELQISAKQARIRQAAQGLED